MFRRLNFGCGKDIKKDWDNWDILNLKGIKNVDFNQFPYPAKDKTYEYIFVNSVLEYLKEPYKVLKELSRICKKNAIIEIYSAYYNNIGATNLFYSEHYFSEQTFEFLEKSSWLYNDKISFRIEVLELLPTSFGKWIYPKWFRNKLAHFVGGIIGQVHVKLRIIK